MTINLHVDMKVEEFCMARYWHYDRRGNYSSMKLLDRWCCQCNLCVYSRLAGFCMQDHIFTLMRTQDWVEKFVPLTTTSVQQFQARVVSSSRHQGI